MGSPVNIPVVTDLAIGASRVNMLSGIPQRVLTDPSRIDVALSRESVDVTYQLMIGASEAIPPGSPCNINTVVGTLPRFDTDGVGSFLGMPGDEVSLFGTNVNAAAQELRAQFRITALDDLQLLPTNLA